MRRGKSRATTCLVLLLLIYPGGIVMAQLPECLPWDPCWDEFWEDFDEQMSGTDSSVPEQDAECLPWDPCWDEFWADFDVHMEATMQAHNEAMAELEDLLEANDQDAEAAMEEVRQMMEDMNLPVFEDNLQEWFSDADGFPVAGIPDIDVPAVEPIPSAGGTPSGESRRPHANVDCAEVREEALAYGTPPLDARGDIGAPVLWDGTPFIVDVSASFSNAEELLGMVTKEARRIKNALGHNVIEPGEVLALPDIGYMPLVLSVAPSPPQYLEISCCLENIEAGGGVIAGIAAIHLRRVVLRPEEEYSRHALIHELYHLLGFVHPGDPVGVVMSQPLNEGERGPYGGFIQIDDQYIPLGGAVGDTKSATEDLDNLACIFDRE